MIVKESHLAEVVAEVSAGAADPKHVATVVGGFIQLQPSIGQYVSAHADELGLEGVVLTLLHAAVVARAVEVAQGSELAPVRFTELDAAAAGDRRLVDDEPELAGYIEGNLAGDDATLGGARRATALRLLGIIAYALLDLR